MAVILFDLQTNVLLYLEINHIRFEHSLAAFCGVLLLLNQLRFFNCPAFGNNHCCCDDYYCDQKDGNQH